MRAVTLLGLIISGCTGGSNPAGEPPSVEPTSCDDRALSLPQTDFFTDISEPSGIQIGNFDPDPPEAMVINDHSRLTFADLNGDGFDDIVMHSLYPNARNGIPF